MPKIKAVLLDLDGTLRDTQEIIYSSIEHALKVQTGKKFSRKSMEPYIHHHREVYRGLVGEEGLDKFDEIYTAKIREQILGAKLFEGVNEVIKQLRADGYRLALVSSARQGMAYLRHHGLHEHFEVSVGAQDVTRLKPDPEPVITALQKLKISADEAVMVGDMTADVLSAKGAGVKHVIGITHGFGTREELEAAGVDYSIDSLAELPTIIKAIERG